MVNLYNVGQFIGNAVEETWNYVVKPTAKGLYNAAKWTLDPRTFHSKAFYAVAGGTAVSIGLLGPLENSLNEFTNLDIPPIKLMGTVLMDLAALGYAARLQKRQEES